MNSFKTFLGNLAFLMGCIVVQYAMVMTVLSMLETGTTAEEYQQNPAVVEQADFKSDYYYFQ